MKSRRVVAVNSFTVKGRQSGKLLSEYKLELTPEQAEQYLRDFRDPSSLLFTDHRARVLADRDAAGRSAVTRRARAAEATAAKYEKLRDDDLDRAARAYVLLDRQDKPPSIEAIAKAAKLKKRRVEDLTLKAIRARAAQISAANRRKRPARL
jgi:hypothetical protein